MDSTSRPAGDPSTGQRHESEGAALGTGGRPSAPPAGGHGARSAAESFVVTLTGFDQLQEMDTYQHTVRRKLLVDLHQRADQPVEVKMAHDRLSAQATFLSAEDMKKALAAPIILQVAESSPVQLVCHVDTQVYTGCRATLSPLMASLFPTEAELQAVSNAAGLSLHFRSNGTSTTVQGSLDDLTQFREALQSTTRSMGATANSQLGLQKADDEAPPSREVNGFQPEPNGSLQVDVETTVIGGGSSGNRVNAAPPRPAARTRRAAANTATTEDSLPSATATTTPTSTAACKPTAMGEESAVPQDSGSDLDSSRVQTGQTSDAASTTGGRTGMAPNVPGAHLQMTPDEGLARFLNAEEGMQLRQDAISQGVQIVLNDDGGVCMQAADQGHIHRVRTMLEEKGQSWISNRLLPNQQCFQPLPQDTQGLAEHPQHQAQPDQQALRHSQRPEEPARQATELSQQPSRRPREQPTPDPVSVEWLEDDDTKSADWKDTHPVLPERSASGSGTSHTPGHVSNPTASEKTRNPASLSRRTASKFMDEVSGTSDFMKYFLETGDIPKKALKGGIVMQVADDASSMTFSSANQSKLNGFMDDIRSALRDVQSNDVDKVKVKIHITDEEQLKIIDQCREMCKPVRCYKEKQWLVLLGGTEQERQQGRKFIERAVAELSDTPHARPASSMEPERATQGYHPTLRQPASTHHGQTMPRAAVAAAGPPAKTKTINGVTVSIVQGDITKMKVSAIVNAANAVLDPKGGLALVIANAGGPEIERDCIKKLQKLHKTQLQPGNVLSSVPGRLPCKHVIHAVGPDCRYHTSLQDKQNSDAVLKRAVMGSLREAARLNAKSLSLPAISTGTYKMPVADCADTTIRTILEFISEQNPPPHVLKQITIVLFDRPMVPVFQRALGQVSGPAEAAPGDGVADAAGPSPSQPGKSSSWYPDAPLQPSVAPSTFRSNRGSVHPLGRMPTTSAASQATWYSSPSPAAQQQPAVQQWSSLKPLATAPAATCAGCSSLNISSSFSCGHPACTTCSAKSYVWPTMCQECKALAAKPPVLLQGATMRNRIDPRSLAGFEECTTIEIMYYVPAGWWPDHPSGRGTRYPEDSRAAYLPNSQKGNKLLLLLQEALRRGVTFTIGYSESRRVDNVVVWNGIEHKTNVGGGRAGFGYPDSDYLSRLEYQLANRGIK